MNTGDFMIEDTNGSSNGGSVKLTAPTLNDWQTMHMRKEIEEIHKSAGGRDTVSHALIMDIFLLLLGFGFDQMFEDNTVAKVFVIIACIALAGTLLGIAINAWIRNEKRNIASQVKSVKEVVDIIDNKLCYYLMTAESMTQCGIGINSDIERFYMMEACYYLNKCTMLLMQVDNNLLSSIYSGEDYDDYDSGRISYTRISNIFSLIEKMYFRIENVIGNTESMPKDVKKIADSILDENIYFRGKFAKIKERITKEFESEDNAEDKAENDTDK